MAENQMNYYDYFKNFVVGSKSNLGFLEIGKNIIKIRKEIQKIWNKILILNPFCPEIKREYLCYIKEMLNDEKYYEKELKYYNSLIASNSDEKNNFYYKLYDNLNSAILLSEYNSNKIIYSTPNFKKNILLSYESNDLTINSLLPNNIEKFHQHLINEALLYSNIEHIFTKQVNNIMIKTKNNTLLNTKLFLKELPNLSYGLIFIIHIEKIINNEFRIVLDKDFKINGYSDEANSLKKDNYENYGLIPSFLGTHICALIPEILLCLTNINKNEENNNNIGKDIYLQNKIINQRGNIYKYNMPSPSKHILDKINSIINDIKKNGLNINEIIPKLEEHGTKHNSNFSENSILLNDERNIGDKYSDLIKEIEYNTRKSIKIEFEIAERSFLNNKYKYYIITINKDIYNFEENDLEQISVNIKNPKSKKNSFSNQFIFQSELYESKSINETKRFEKEIKLRVNRKINANDINEKNKEDINKEPNEESKDNKENEKQKHKNQIQLSDTKEANVESLEKIKQKILDNKLNTKYGLIMLYLSIITIIISFICLIYNYLDGENNLKNLSNFLQQNLYYNKTRINVSHMFITFINIIIFKSGFLKDFTTDDYKERLKDSINNIFDLNKDKKNLNEDYYKIFSEYSEIYIKNPFDDYSIKINMTNFQVIELIVSESLKFSSMIDEFLVDNEDSQFYYSLIGNIDNLSNFYINFNFNGFNNKEIEKKISQGFNKIPFVLIFVCIIIVILLIIYSYIIYTLTYYENFFLVKIINSNSKEFEDYLKHFEELKFRLKNVDYEENQTIENEENNDEMTGDINEDKIVQKYTISGENNEEKLRVNDRKKTVRNSLKRKMFSGIKDNNLESRVQNDLEDKQSKEVKKKNKNSKKDKAKKIKLIEQKKLKLKKMTRLIIFQNFLIAIKIGLSVFLTITYYVIQAIYSNIKTNKFINFNHNIESVESVFTESFITYFDLKKEILKFSEFYKNNEEKINNNLMDNYTLKIQNNKNYTSPDFNNILMEILKDFKNSTGGIEGNLSQLFNEDGCEILYNSENNDFQQCQEFWSGVIYNGLHQTIIQMGSQFSIILSSLSLINKKKENLENIINSKVWKEFDYFFIYYLYDSFHKSSILLNELRIKFIDKNDNTYDFIFYSYLIGFFIIASIFIFFVYSLVLLFNDFLNFIAIIPVKILYEDRDINEEIIKLSKQLY